jgi:hypothetical protein
MELSGFNVSYFRILTIFNCFRFFYPLIAMLAAGNTVIVKASEASYTLIGHNLLFLGLSCLFVSDCHTFGEDFPQGNYLLGLF